MQARSRATIEKIQAATEALIAREGIGSLTMDAVASEARLSKGGVLHHFRSKEALVASLATHKLQAMRDGFMEESRRFAGQPAPALRGMVEHAGRTYGDESFSRALLVATVENSASLDEFRRLFAEGLSQVREESRDPGMSTALLFAVIGLQVSRTLGFAQLPPDQVKAVFDALHRLAAESGAIEPGSSHAAEGGCT